MSISIHPAFLVSSDANLFEVAEGLRAALIPYLTDEFRKEAVSLAVREFDSVDEISSGLEFSEFLATSNNRLNRNLSGDLETFDKYDLLPFRRVLDFQAMFLRNKVRGETYVLFSGDVLGRAAEELVLGVEGIESDFSYWNGSDSQINGSSSDITLITEEEWLRRGESWRETINFGRGIPQQGVVAKFFESLSSYELLSWKSYEGQAEMLVAELAPEERFRRIVFHAYLESLRKVYPDLDIMDTINGSWRFLNPKKEREYDKLPFAEEQKIRLNDAVLFAEKRVAAFPIAF